ncbi:hypothetical protein [Demequina sp. NBRC 110057]|uniref:hypothetical protein n=1 Tax=Demequina sp. NBRC 110057 TaxID=1570346 RepID=UPI000A0711C3|nr:hypothetical protein [Demequina sp. NBRC 110057]
MRDAHDAMHEAGRSRAAGILAALGDPDALASDVRAARSARRGRSWLRGGAACVALVAVGASFLSLRPDPPLGSIAAADGVVGEAAIMRMEDRLGGYCDMSLSPPPYVPFADRGVTIASEEVRDMGIEIHARPVEFTYNDGYAVKEVPYEGVLLVEGDPGEDPTSLLAAITVSWDGDALYDVDASAYLVSGGRLISGTVGWPVDFASMEAGLWGFDTAVPSYDPVTDRSSLSFISTLQPECLGSVGALDWPYLAPDLTTTVHTFVQVRDEDGNPLVTNLDAAGFDGTTVEFPGYQEADLVTSLSPAPVDEVERAEASAANAVPQDPQRSAAAAVRDVVAEDGIALPQADSGVRLAGSCAANAELVAAEGLDLRVLDADLPADIFPSEVPAAAVAGDDWWSSVEDSADEWSYWSQEGHLLLLDPDTSQLVAGAPVQVDVLMDPDTGDYNEVVGVSNPTEASCGNLPLPSAGTYRALLVMPYDGTPVVGLQGGWEDAVATWRDAGTLTLTD